MTYVIFLENCFNKFHHFPWLGGTLDSRCLLCKRAR